MASKESTESLLSNPILALHSISNAHDDIQSLLIAFQGKIRAHINSIPLLGDVPITKSDSKLVLFRGMVQDISDPVYYLSKLSIVSTNTNEIRCIPTIFPDSYIIPDGWKRQEKFQNPTNEYHVIHSISPPNETEWCKSEWLSRFHCRPNDFSKNANSLDILIYNGIDKIKLNEMILFYGVLCTTESTLTLHCLLYDTLYYNNPLLPFHCSPKSCINLISHLSLLNVRQKLIEQLQFCASGDCLAAEYLLFNLLSRISVRRDVTLVGKFSLNLTQSSTSLSNQISSIYPKLLPRFLYIPISLSSLQERQFVPCKDYSTEKLSTGYLQLIDDTVILLDETRLESGKLNSSGLSALNALSELVTTQCVKYDFSFHTLPFNVNVSVLIVTDGKKSLISADVILPLVPSDDISSRPEISSKDLEEFRLFLSTVRYLSYDLNEDMQTDIQKDWVEMRKMNKNLGPDDLSMILTVARYLTLSRGETKLSKETWIEAREMEEKRTMRLKLPK